MYDTKLLTGHPFAALYSARSVVPWSTSYLVMLPFRSPPLPCNDAATRMPTSRPSNQAPCKNPKYCAELASPANHRFSTLARKFWCLSSVTPTGQLLYEPNDHLEHPSGQPQSQTKVVIGKTHSSWLHLGYVNAMGSGISLSGNIDRSTSSASALVSSSDCCSTWYD